MLKWWNNNLLLQSRKRRTDLGFVFKQRLTWVQCKVRELYFCAKKIMENEHDISNLWCEFWFQLTVREYDFITYGQVCGTSDDAASQQNISVRDVFSLSRKSELDVKMKRRLFPVRFGSDSLSWGKKWEVYFDSVDRWKPTDPMWNKCTTFFFYWCVFENIQLIRNKLYKTLWIPLAFSSWSRQEYGGWFLLIMPSECRSTKSIQSIILFL